MRNNPQQTEQFQKIKSQIEKLEKERNHNTTVICK